MGSQNGIIGDESNYGLDLPDQNPDESAIVELQKTARFSKTAEFKALKAHLQSRISYYEKFLPGQVPAENVPDEERGKYWAIANIVISEFNSVITAYEEAANILKDEATKRSTT